MNFKWIKCKDKLPENPKSPLEWNKYLTVKKFPATGDYGYDVDFWADGWNCSMNFDGTFDKEFEDKNIIAWAEIPPYEE